MSKPKTRSFEVTLVTTVETVEKRLILRAKDHADALGLAQSGRGRQLQRVTTRTPRYVRQVRDLPPYQ